MKSSIEREDIFCFPSSERIELEEKKKESLKIMLLLLLLSHFSPV